MNLLLKEFSEILLKVEERLTKNILSVKDQIKTFEKKVDNRFKRLEEKVRLLARIRNKKVEVKEVKRKQTTKFLEFRNVTTECEKYIEMVCSQNQEFLKSKQCFTEFVKKYFVSDHDCNIILSTRLYIYQKEKRMSTGVWLQIKGPAKKVQKYLKNAWEAFKDEVEAELMLTSDECTEMLPEIPISLDDFRKLISKVSDRSRENRV